MEELPYEEIEHTADLALRVRGKDMAQLLKHAAEGMLHLSAVHTKSNEGSKVSVELKAPDREQLLVVWLEELLFGIETRTIGYRDFDIRVVEDTRCEASMREIELESIGKHIKAVTFHDLRIVATQEGLEATIVFDV
jgi:SHS2 domain-containing protein